MTCHDFQIGQHLSKNVVICWVKSANFGKLLLLGCPESSERFLEE
jgi:hypothetical protein